jgi:hypothetical protein
MNAKQIEAERTSIADAIARQYGIDSERVYFLSERKPLDPWIPPDQLMTITRQVGGFQRIEEQFDTFIAALNQIVHRAVVIDEQGRAFVRSGVATLGEKTPAGVELDEHQLAGGRALSAAITAAGCNPFKTNANKPGKPSIEMADDLPEQDGPYQREADLALIHQLAEDAGLIFPDEESGRRNVEQYRRWVRETCKGMGLGDNVTSVARLDQKQRACIIAALRQAATMNLV